MGIIPSFDGRYGRELATTNSNSGVNLYHPPARNSGLESVGEAVGGIAKVAGELYIAQQKRVAADYTTKKSAEIQEHTIRTMAEAKQKALESGNVEGFTDNFLQTFDKIGNKSLEDAPNNLAASDMQERLSQTRNSLLESSMRFEAAAKIDIYKHNLDVATDTQTKSGIMDPSQLPILLKQSGENMIGAENILGKIDAEKYKIAARNQIVAASISKVIEDNPWQAQNMIKQYSDDLSPKDIMALNNNAHREIVRIEKAAVKARAQAAEMSAIFGAMNNNIALNAADPKVQKILDKSWNSLKESNPDLDPISFMEKTNFMPTQVRNELAGRLASGSDEQKVNAAAQLELIHERLPNLVDKISRADKAKASLISSYIEAGVVDKRAVERAENEINNKDDLVMKLRNDNYKKEDELKWEDIKGGFNSNIPDNLKIDYELLAKGYYMEGLPAHLAKKNALNDMKAIWFESDVTGVKRMMKNSPEIEYKVPTQGEDQYWMREQLETDWVNLKQLIPADKKDVKDFILRPSLEKNKEGQTEYDVLRVNKDTGDLSMVFNEDGGPLRWKPNWETSPAYKRILDQIPGNNFEEKKANYIKLMQEQQAKLETRGQQPTPVVDPYYFDVTPKGVQ